MEACGARRIEARRSIIPACDVTTLEDLAAIVRATADLEGIGGYKIGFSLALRFGLRAVVAEIRRIAPLPLIYDHQKAGTDVPDTGRLYARTCKACGVDYVILFPQAGLRTQAAWTEALLSEGLYPVIGGLMTHEGYLADEGGHIAFPSVLRIYEEAARAGVRDFVIPATRPDRMGEILSAIERHCPDPVLFSPGFIAQGGRWAPLAEAAGGRRLHAIVGRAIYRAEDMRRAAAELIAGLG
jgi:orotidine-5'-phosphate decarboxylase